MERLYCDCMVIFVNVFSLLLFLQYKNVLWLRNCDVASLTRCSDWVEIIGRGWLVAIWLLVWRQWNMIDRSSWTWSNNWEEKPSWFTVKRKLTTCGEPIGSRKWLVWSLEAFLPRSLHVLLFPAYSLRPQTCTHTWSSTVMFEAIKTIRVIFSLIVQKKILPPLNVLW